MNYKLHYAPDNASLIIRIFLEEIDAKYKCILIDRKKNSQKDPKYLALNPNGLIPVLETNDGPIFETAAILLWLADRHKSNFPTIENNKRAYGLKWLFFLSNTVHASLRILFYSEKYIDSENNKDFRKNVSNQIKNHLTLLNLEVGDKMFFLCNTPSILDIYLCVMLRWMKLYPVQNTDWFSLERYKNLESICQNLEIRASVRLAAKAEGLGQTIFSNPSYAKPPIGSAT